MESMYTILPSSCPLWPITRSTSKKFRIIICHYHPLLMMLRNSMSQANPTTQNRRAKPSLSNKARKVRKVRKLKRRMMLRTS